MKRFLSLVLALILVCTSIFLYSCEREGIFIYELNQDGNGYVVSALVKDPLIVLDGNIIEDHNGLPVTEIKDAGFFGWNNLYLITVPGTVKRIGNYAFGQSGIVSAELNEGVEHIDDNAFAFCENLSIIYLPGTLKYIGHGAFGGCTSLATIVYNGTIAQWNALAKGENWCYNAGVYEPIAVSCIDGVLTFYSYELE